MFKSVPKSNAKSEDFEINSQSTSKTIENKKKTVIFKNQDVDANIQRYQQSIAVKTSSGFSLAQQIAASVEENKFQKQQMYDLFISKMDQLYKSELRYKINQKKQLALQRMAPLYSQTPLKDILRSYNEMTSRGFNSELVTFTLKNVEKALRARGFRPRVMQDYTHEELEQSWRLQKVIDDIQFGLKPEQFFSTVHLAHTCNLLGDMGYKNTTLMSDFFNKLNILLDERLLGTKHHWNFEFEHAVYGGPRNFIPRHYIYRGFENSEEFQSYLKILMDYEKEPKNRQTPKSQKELDQDALELQNAIKDTIDAAVQVKELQKDFQSTIDNLRTQYFMMQEAIDKHSFLKENDYIRYDLLELQEMLVKGGYMDPDEANKALDREPFESKMERASQVFYDYVLNYAPELISPQHNSFYEAAMRSLSPSLEKKERQKKIDTIINESHNLLTLGTLSQALIGLQKQALSYRRDIARKDYLHQFYEDHVMTNEKFRIKYSEQFYDKEEYVLMQRGYLRGWKIFMQESEKLLPYLRELVEVDKESLAGQLHALSALAICKLYDTSLQSKIIERSNALLKNQVNVPPKAIKNGIYGLALSPFIDDQARELALNLSEKLDIKDLKFQDQLDVLWSLCNLELYQSKALQSLVKHFNSLTFERLDHDLLYDEYQKILDIIQALKIEGPKNLQITNPGLIEGFNGREFYENSKFKESQEKYDPFKKRVVKALSKGLTQASIQHEAIMQNELQNQVLNDQKLLGQDKYPYIPDIVMGYRGQKVAVFVLPQTGVMRDTYHPDGYHRLQMRLLQKAQQEYNLQTVAIAIPKVVSIDIEGLKISINTHFDFQKELERQVPQLKDNVSLNNINNFETLAELGRGLVNERGLKFVESLQAQKEVKQIDAFIKKLMLIFQLKQQTELRFSPEQRNTGYDEVRYQLMLLSLMYDGLSKHCKNYMASILPSKQKSVKDLIKVTAQSIMRENTQTSSLPSGLDQGWVGTRLDVELPSQHKSLNLKKSIIPELINQRFMWVQDYFHYKDWQLQQQEVYDNFNLLIIPPHKDETKFFFDQDNYHRRIPVGIFPNPLGKRVIMQPHAQKHALDIARLNGAHDSLFLFEKEPMKHMVLTELKKSEELKPINAQVGFITNLQNVKQGLKSDYSDREILNTILLNLNFTDQLIDEHLGLAKSQKRQDSPKEDPYTHFLLKEASMKEALAHEYQQEKERQLNVEDGSDSATVLDEGKKRRQKLQDKIDKVLLEERMRNEDLINISSPLEQNIRVNYDMKTLVKSEQIFDIDPDLVDQGISDVEYLRLARRRAEQKLIKSKIIYKINQQDSGVELTPKEKLYLKKWLSEIQANEHSTLYNLRDTMLPEKESQLTLNDIDAKNYYALNSIPKVQFDRDQHGSFALNDLVLELSHFIDEEVVNKVETELFSDRLRNQWGLSKDFQVIETRNKEISLVLNELEEIAFRSAAQFTEKDLENVKKMISVKRNKDIIDQEYFENDMKSYEAFLKEINFYDDRIKLLERWIVRKEDEIKDRLIRPPANLKKTEQDLFQQYDKPLKAARERLVAQLLTADEHGNPIKKNYTDLTSRDLSVIAENVCVRLYLFNYEYPSFVPQMVKALVEHPNLLKSDQNLLRTYCQIFELDWKCDQNMDNTANHMYTHPIYIEGTNLKSYGQITEAVVKDKLRKACVPYVEEVASKILSMKL